MIESKKNELDYEPAKIFNTHQENLGLRLGTFTNYLLAVDGGVLSITIGAFLNGSPPRVAPDALVILRAGWWLLTSGLILALTASFCVLLGQAIVHLKMRKKYEVGDEERKLELITGPGWLRPAIWLAVIASFLASVSGLAAMCWGASAMLRLA